MPIWSQDACISALALSLLHSLWQGAILGLMGVALTRRLRRSTPDVRYVTYSLLLLAMFAVWLGTFCSLYSASAQSAELARTQPGVVVLSVTALPAAIAPAGLWTVSRLQPLFPLLVALWAMGVCLLSLRHLGGFLMLQGMCRAATDSCPPEWAAFAERIAAEMGIRRQVLLRCTSKIDVPCAFGVFKSYILLPLGVMAGLTPQQAEALIAHEMAHLARHDVLFNAIQVCMETAMFYHPAVRWLSMQVRAAREQRCDDLAIQFLGDRVVYARALFSLEEARAPIPRLALGAKGENSHMSNTHLVTRIQRVLGVSGPERRDPWIKGVIALGAVAAGLAMLHPVHAFDTTPSGSAAPAPTHKTVLAINGDKVELYGDMVTADSLITVNGKQERFGDLTLAQQKAIQEAISTVSHGRMVTIMSSTKAGRPSTMTAESMRIHRKIGGDDIELESADFTPDALIKVNGKQVRFGDMPPKLQQAIRQPFQTMSDQELVTVLSTADGGVHNVLVRDPRSLRMILNIGSDKVEFASDDVNANTAITVNGKPKRVGDLTEAQQKQLKEAIDAVSAPPMPGVSANDEHGDMLIRMDTAMLNVNGDKVEIDDAELTSESAVTINGKRVRFGDLSPAKQQALRQAVDAMPRRPLLIARGFVKGGTPAMGAISLDGSRSFRAMLNINGDEIELDTQDLTADTSVKVNGKSIRFGDLTEAQQKQLKEAVSPMTAMPGRPASIMRTVPAGLAVPAVDAIPATPAP